MDSEFSSCEAVIVSLAKRWERSLPLYTMYDRSDLISEGWIIYLKCKEKDIDCKFTTYLYIAVSNRFNRICSSERLDVVEQSRIFKYPKRRRHIHVSDDHIINNIQEDVTPERLMMVKEAVAALAEVSSDFALMMVDGVPKELYSIALRHMRGKKFVRQPKTTNNNVTYTKAMIEDFFGIDLKILKKLVSNYL